jgi:pectin methylesterase-like acyl-CoA thioesterase
MFDKLSEKNIWVSAKNKEFGDGSFENPYSKIQAALDNAVAGSNVVLFSGIYDEKLIVRDISGTIDEPITITGEDVVSNSEWYFYSASDFVIKNIKFEKTGNSAISIVGESQRNSIKDCEFSECGEVAECALFFGGSGGDFNSVENC